MRIILVTGAYGSGTTALAGALAAFGIPAPGPFFETNDPRIPESFEHVAFRDLMLALVDENEMRIRDMPDETRQAACLEFAEKFHAAMLEHLPDDTTMPILLKSPAACLCLPYLKQVFDMDVLVMHRPFEAIEKTRKRRGWYLQFGAAGAKTLYDNAYTDLIAHEISWLSVSFNDLLYAREKTLRQVIAYCGLSERQASLSDATGFIRC